MDETQGQAAPAPKPAAIRQEPDGTLKLDSLKVGAVNTGVTAAGTAPPPADPQSRKGKIEAVVRKWASDRAANSPLSRSTEAWNHLQEEIPTLVDALVEEIG